VIETVYTGVEEPPATAEPAAKAPQRKPGGAA
jgi:hypothetical protein